MKDSVSEQLSSLTVERITKFDAPASIHPILNTENNTTSCVPSQKDDMQLPSVQFQEYANITLHTDNNYLDNNSNLNIDHYIENECLESKLQKWVSKFHVAHNCINALLTILRSEGLQLPKDTRTLLNTSKTGNHNIISVHPGSYIHLSVEFMLHEVLFTYIDNFENNFTIQLSLNIDGVPLSSNSKLSFWPILLSFINVHYLTKIVVPIGLYHGKFKKPSSSFEFLNHFITEFIEIISNGLNTKNKTLRFVI